MGVAPYLEVQHWLKAGSGWRLNGQHPEVGPWVQALRDVCRVDAWGSLVSAALRKMWAGGFDKCVAARVGSGLILRLVPARSNNLARSLFVSSSLVGVGEVPSYWPET